jgi:hypothetical protein
MRRHADTPITTFEDLLIASAESFFGTLPRDPKVIPQLLQKHEEAVMGRAKELLASMSNKEVGAVIASMLTDDPHMIVRDREMLRHVAFRIFEDLAVMLEFGWDE